jgi:hypothetical protein
MKIGPAGSGIVFLLALVTASQGRADTFMLSNGQQFEGVVVQGNHNSVIVKNAASGSLIPLPLSLISSVRIVADDGATVIEGELLSWGADGLHVLRVDQQRLVEVRGGQVVSVTGPTPEPTRVVPSSSLELAAPQPEAPQPPPQPTEQPPAPSKITPTM